MRDISAKVKTLRIATARATLTASPVLIQRIKDGDIPKGDPLPVAKVAAISAAKNTSQIIPYCHPVPVEFVGVEFDISEDSIQVTTTVKSIYKTGVEMEALTAASVAALTIYDMLKMLDESMEITGVHLVSKSGGKSDFKQKIAGSLKAAVLVMSDSIAAGAKSDVSGQAISERLKAEGLEVVDYQIVPDDKEKIRGAIEEYSDRMNVDLIITTGGTGTSPTDVTPEALEGLIQRDLPGVAEAIRSYGQERTPYSMLSRSQAGIRNRTLILALPGSSGGVKDSLDALFPAVLHAFKMLRGGGHKEDSRSLVKEGQKQ